MSLSEDAHQAESGGGAQLEHWRSWLRRLERDHEADSPLEPVYARWRSQVDRGRGPGVSRPQSRAVEAAVEFMMLGEQLLRALSSLPPGTAVEMPAANPLGRAFTEAHAGGDGRGAEQDLWSSMLSAIPAEIRVALNRLNADYRKRSIRGLPTTAGTVLARELLHVLGTGSGPDAESWDADVRRLLREWSMFQSAQARYEALLVDAAESALARMSERIAERAAGGRPLNTVRAAYDLWIECSETSYAALLASDDFADAHASAINALVVVKAGCSRLGDRVGELLNAPSRQAYSSLEQRLHAARREQRRQRERLDQLERHCEGLDDRLRVLEGPPADSTKRERS